MAYVTQQIIKTTEGWATFDALGKPVPKDYWLFERIAETVGDVTRKYYKFKISDGASLFADLPYQLLNGHSASINDAGNWLVYDDATQTYKDSGVKAIGVDGKSAFELWQAIEGNADKTIVDFYVFLKGEKGDAFTFDDFTIEQLALLKGASAYQVWKAQPGNEGKTVDEYLQYIKGAPFTYADFTPEQIIALTGKSAYQIWLDQPGNEGKTVEEYLIAIKGRDGQSAYLDAVAKGYSGTKDEFDTLLAGITSGGGYLDLNFLSDAEGNFISSITQEQLNIIRGAYENKVVAAKIGDGVTPINIIFSANVCIVNVNMTTILNGSAILGVIIFTINTDVLTVKVELAQGTIRHLDLSDIFSEMGDLPTEATDELIGRIKNAYDNNVCLAKVDEGGFLLLSISMVDAIKYEISVFSTVASSGSYGVFSFGLTVLSYRIFIDTVTKSLNISFCSIDLFRDGGGTKALMDNGTYKPVVSPTDIEALASLSTLSPTKYSQKYTYTSTTAQGINFSSTPEEGFECMLDIKNGTSSQITQAIPNAAAWQCDETSLAIPAGKIGCISIRYVHGKYCVRVGL